MQTVSTQIRRCRMQHLIWVYPICQCPFMGHQALMGEGIWIMNGKVPDSAASDQGLPFSDYVFRRNTMADFILSCDLAKIVTREHHWQYLLPRPAVLQSSEKLDCSMQMTANSQSVSLQQESFRVLSSKHSWLWITGFWVLIGLEANFS